MSKHETLSSPESKKPAAKPLSRRDYSHEEIQSLLAGIEAVVSSHKAEQQGIDTSNMIKTVRGGKVVWITKEEMNVTLARRRKVSGVKHAQRSIRGDDSLSSEINRRIQECNVLLNSIRKVSPEDTRELARAFRELRSIQNRVASLARDVRILETAIKRKRAEDSVLRDMDEATSNMVTAMQDGQLEEAEICKSYSERHMDEYLAKEKRLKPYIVKARQCRRDFLLHRQRLFQVQFNLIARGEEVLREKIPDIVYRDKQGHTSQQLATLADEILALVEAGRPSFEGLTECSEEQPKDQKERLAALDKEFLIPLFSQITKYVEAFWKAWSNFVEGALDQPAYEEPHPQTPDVSNAPTSLTEQAESKEKDHPGMWVDVRPDESVEP